LGAAECVALAWQRFFVAHAGSPLGLRGVYGNKTGPNTINTNDESSKPRPMIINDLVQHGCVSLVVFHVHPHDFIFCAEWPRNFCPMLYHLGACATEWTHDRCGVRKHDGSKGGSQASDGSVWTISCDCFWRGGVKARITVELCPTPIARPRRCVRRVKTARQSEARSFDDQTASIGSTTVAAVKNFECARASSRIFPIHKRVRRRTNNSRESTVAG
jgi:hypothetical protein